MANIIVVGTQWGDEGKGKIVDVLTKKADIIARFQGGANAGHTVKVGDEEFILHLIPSGIVHPDKNKKCVIGAGVVVDPKSLMNEFCYLRNKNIDLEHRLFIDERAHVTMLYHRVLDIATEISKGSKKIGTTRRGIANTYVDKYSRGGIRITDLIDEKRFREKLSENIEEKVRYMNKVLGIKNEDIFEILKELKEIEKTANSKLIERGLIKEEFVDFPRYYDKESGFSLEAMMEDFLKISRKIAPYIKDTSVILNNAVSANKKILFEGAQGTFLDIDFGTYPFVTSSNPIAGGALTGLGIGPTVIDNVLGVVKAYVTRVGSGVFPTEYESELQNIIREKGKEYGTTTGRSRRCGWFDAIMARTAAYLNRLDNIAITKLDVLSCLDEIKICTAYQLGDKVLKTFPSDISVLNEVAPVYETLKGWKTDIANVRNYDELPNEAKFYVQRIRTLMEEAPGNPKIKIRYISVGPKRDQIIEYENDDR